MMKFIICEDSQDALERASQTVTKTMMNYDIEYKVDKFTKYDKELKKVIRDKNDIKFYILDIELPIVSGLEIASEIREIDDESTIVFVTSHSECKNDIFYSRLQAIDFISKYHRYQERLEETIKYVIDRIYKRKTLEFSFNYVHYKLLYEEINYVEKYPSQNKCILHLVDKSEVSVSSSLTKLKEELGSIFYQTHKACLVNLTNIKRIDFANYTIYFKNGDSTDLLTPTARKELRNHVRHY